MRTCLFTCLALMLSLCSCNFNVKYQSNNDIENDSWNISNVLTHNVEITDSMEVYNMFISVRNTVDYKYENLFMFVTTKFPNGKMAKDTLECILADKMGKWYGKGNGKYKDSKILFMPKVRFPQNGKYVIEIQQAMREEPLVGISNIGIILEKVN